MMRGDGEGVYGSDREESRSLNTREPASGRCRDPNWSATVRVSGMRGVNRVRRAAVDTESVPP